MHFTLQYYKCYFYDIWVQLWRHCHCEGLTMGGNVLILRHIKISNEISNGRLCTPDRTVGSASNGTFSALFPPFLHFFHTILCVAACKTASVIQKSYQRDHFESITLLIPERERVCVHVHVCVDEEHFAELRQIQRQHSDMSCSLTAVFRPRQLGCVYSRKTF